MAPLRETVVTLLRAVLSPLLFGLVGLTFFLPFAMMTIHDGEGARLTQDWSGVDLFTGARGEYRFAFTDVDGKVVELRGSEIKQLGAAAPMPDPDEGHVMARQPALVVALIGTVLGVLAGLLPRTGTRTVVSSVTATVTVAALTIGLLLVWDQLRGTYGSHPQYLGYPPGPGYWWAAGLLVLLSVGNAVEARLHRTSQASWKV